MKIEDDKGYLQDILERIGRVEKYLSGLSLKGLEKKELNQCASAWMFETIGWSIGHLTSDFKKSRKDTSFTKAKLLGRKFEKSLGHFDASNVWDGAHNVLPDLKVQVQEALKTL